MFAQRMNNIQKSFIREILKVIKQDDVISFAGGLPNPNFFPVEGIKKATEKVDVLEKLAVETAMELAEATAGEFAAKAELANAKANYAKVEAYALGAMKKSSPSIFGDCNPRLNEKFVFEDELNIHWFK